MSTSTVHQPSPKHSEHATLWQKCRDAIKGQDAIKAEEQTYLPRLSGQEDKDYKKYIQQAYFYNATGRTFGAYKGLVFRKDPAINDEGLEDFTEDCTLAGTSLVEFAREAVAEELKVSRFGILVDYPSVPSDTGMSQAEAEQQGIRPFLVAYKAEDIIGDPEMTEVGGRTVLGKIRLLEHYSETDPDDEFKQVQKERVRVLDLTEDHPFGGVEEAYRQRVFLPKDGKADAAEWFEDEDQRWYPRMGGAPITEIPFFMVGGWEYRTPHMLDLVNTNLNHYIADADHSRGVAWTTRPQPWVTGASDDDMPESLMLGGGSLWNFPSPDAEVGMLEYSGEGLTASENLLDRREEQMANLGARMLMPETTQGPETATEFVLKKQGENSSLGSVAKMVGQALTKAMQFAARWLGEDSPDEVGISLNTDFVPVQATPDDLVKMIGAVQTGKYTVDDYLWWLEQNEMVDPTLEEDERKAALQTDPPPGMGQPNLNGGQ